MTTLQLIILSIVEGITEFLPVSSTGHLIIASSLMGLTGDAFIKTFTVAVQLGAILSVVVLYRKKFFRSFQFYVRLAVAVVPVLIAGLLLKHRIDIWLGDVRIVAFTLLGGGIVLLFVDKWFSKGVIDDTDKISTIQALAIGFFQVIALMPGVSRAAATIIGGLAQRLTRKAAAEFSFFLAVPTMFAATAKELYDAYKTTPGIFDKQHLTFLLEGNLIAFVVAMLAIRGFIQFLSRYGFRAFGIYRIIVGLSILFLIYVIQVPLKIV